MMSAWDVAVIVVLIAAGVLHTAGVRRLRARGAAVRLVEPAAFRAGCVVTMAAVAPPLDGLAVDRFSAHMAQHELLMLVGAPLIVAGRPILPWLWALPLRVRTAVGGALQQAAPGTLWRGLTAP